jgi:hypothetical protein
MGLWSSKPVPYSDVCSICLEPRPDEIKTKKHKRNFVITKCKHIFHKECLELVMSERTTCPICRTELGDSDVSKKKYKYVATIEEPLNIPASYLTDDYFMSESEEDFETLAFR